MLRLRPLTLLLLVVLLLPLAVPVQAATDEETRATLSRLAERLDKLEAENAALRQRNEDLERRVTQLEPKAAPPAVAATPAPAAPAVASAAAPPAAPPVAQPKPALAAPASIADKPWYERVKVGGLAFGDAYALLQNHDDAVDGADGFWLRRAYLTFDAQIAEAWSARMRFEMNSPGDFTTNSRLNPYVKDLYVSWKRGGQELSLGMLATPTWDLAENFWGERAIEKTALDLYRYGSSRDTGVAWRGKFADGRVFSHVVFGNGSGDGAETNKGKKASASIGFRPVDPLVLQFYADHEDRPGNFDRTTWSALAGWTAERSRYGLQYAYQQREDPSGNDADVSVASAFGVWKLSSQGALVARYDRNFDGYPDASKIPYFRFADDVKFDLALLGWDHKLDPRIHLMPNLEYVMYRDTDGMPAPDDDLYGKLTLYFEF